jgi:hypothetical protein
MYLPTAKGKYFFDNTNLLRPKASVHQEELKILLHMSAMFRYLFLEQV